MGAGGRGRRAGAGACRLRERRRAAERGRDDGGDRHCLDGDDRDDGERAGARDGGERPGAAGASSYPTIQRAVDASRPGDLVLIAPGTYHEAVEVGEEHPDVVIRGVPTATA